MINFHCHVVSVVWKSDSSLLNSITLVVYIMRLVTHTFLVYLFCKSTIGFVGGVANPMADLNKRCKRIISLA